MAQATTGDHAQVSPGKSNRPYESDKRPGFGSADTWGAGGRDAFLADELSIVLSHFEIGTIDAIQEFPRGSRRAPKLIIKSDVGTHLLKRRAQGKHDPFKVAFCHGLQLFLAEKQFPLPHLIGTKKDNNSMLQIGGEIYELFEYIKGTSYDNSLDATADSGKILGLFHKLLIDYRPEYEPPTGSYHSSRQVAMSMDKLPHTLERTNTKRVSENEKQISANLEFLRTSYSVAAMKANEQGLADWPSQIIHSDWHPGNMLFRGPRVVAVIDYDAARMQQRIVDTGNGALQFSIVGGGDDPNQWPDFIDTDRFKAFLEGYDSRQMLTKAELRTVPWLMIEALIAESVVPIAATGSFARMEGIGFLCMVERKVRWLQDNADRLAAMLDG
ncbi:MAG: phosphotransferase [Phycisphaeraceae bacterium]|jgi:Ser/Thr protein kinase RdoA (MazF antagonist)|nr:phosphotransferase [Phycisphaeraceae bacterium]